MCRMLYVSRIVIRDTHVVLRGTNFVFTQIMVSSMSVRRAVVGPSQQFMYREIKF